jgi:hypothetical protein
VPSRWRSASSPERNSAVKTPRWRWQARHGDFVEQREARLQCGDAEEVGRAVFEAVRTPAQPMAQRVDRRVEHCAAREPRSLETLERFAARDERAQAGGEPNSL